MNLAIDIGNSTTIACVIRNGACECKQIIQTHSDDYESELTALFRALLKKNTEIASVTICSVVPQKTDIVKKVTSKTTSLPAQIITQNVKTPVKIGVLEPANIGMDRLASACGAIMKYNPPVIIIDAGTATTFTIVDKTATLVGGAIAPGFKTSVDALLSNTSRLSNHTIKPPNSFIGRDTPQALASGIYNSFIGSAIYILQGIKQENEAYKNAHVLLTGGLGKILKGKLGVETFYEPDLVIEGIDSIRKYQESPA